MGFVVHAVKRRRGEVEYSDGRVIRGWDSAHSLPTIFFFFKKKRQVKAEAQPWFPFEDAEQKKTMWLSL